MLKDKVQVNVTGLKNLLAHARVAGTVDIWADLAMDWATQADAEITRLTNLLRDAPQPVKTSVTTTACAIHGCGNLSIPPSRYCIFHETPLKAKP
jgi:hypothetical protein